MKFKITTTIPVGHENTDEGIVVYGYTTACEAIIDEDDFYGRVDQYVHDHMMEQYHFRPVGTRVIVERIE